VTLFVHEVDGVRREIQGSVRELCFEPACVRYERLRTPLSNLRELR
jgi:hypothetical protein